MKKLCAPKLNILNKTDPKKPNFDYDNQIWVNLKYKSKSTRVNFIPAKQKKKKTLEPTAEELAMQKRIRKERAFVIQAKIVKIMKARKTLNYQVLVSDVIEHIHMFHAETQMIKD